MNDLLANVVAAHGGLDRWNRIRAIRVDAAITGAFWQVKGKAESMKDVRFEVDTTRQRLTMDFLGQNRRSIFEPDRVVLQQADGTVDRRRATTRSGRSTATSSRRRGTTSIWRTSPGKHCGPT